MEKGVGKDKIIDEKKEQADGIGEDGNNGGAERRGFFLRIIFPDEIGHVHGIDTGQLPEIRRGGLGPIHFPLGYGLAGDAELFRQVFLGEAHGLSLCFYFFTIHKKLLLSLCHFLNLL